MAIVESTPCCTFAYVIYIRQEQTVAFRGLAFFIVVYAINCNDSILKFTSKATVVTDRESSGSPNYILDMY